MTGSLAPRLVVFCLVCLCTTAFAQRTTLIAGGVKNGLPATDVMLDDVLGVEVAPDGDLIILQGPYLGLVRRVDAVTGLISTIAGGDKGDRDQTGIPATETQLDGDALAVDAAGNIYVSDGYRIKKIDAVTGILTIIGGKDIGYTGDGGPAVDALIGNQIEDMHVFGNNLYLADYVNRVIRKIDLVTGIISTVAGNGSETLSGDGGPAIDAGIAMPRITTDDDGNIYVAEYLIGSVRKIDINTGVIDLVAGGNEFGPLGDDGPALDGRVVTPYNLIIIDDALYINEYRQKIRKVDLSTGIISTYIDQDATLEIFDFAKDDDDNLYIADRKGLRIKKITDGVFSTVAGLGSFSGDDAPASNASIWKPGGIALLSNEDVVFVDGGNYRVRKIDHATNIITTIAGNGSSSLPVDGAAATASGMEPKGVAVDEDDNIYVTARAYVFKIDAITGNIDIIAGTGTQGFSGDDGQATIAKVDASDQIEYRNGNIYFAESNNDRIRKVDLTTGVITTVTGDGGSGNDGDGELATSASIDSPVDMAVNASGDIYIVAPGVIRKVDGESGLISTVVPYGFWYCIEITPQGNILAGGEFGVSEFGPSGEYRPTFNGPFDPPTQVNSIVYNSEGNIYFTDTFYSKVWMSTVRQEQTVTIDLPPSIKVGETLNVGPPNVTSSSGLPVTVTAYFDVTDAGVIEDNIFTAKKKSNVYLFGDQGGNIDFIPGTASHTFTIEKGDQIITFDAPSDKTLGDAPFELNASVPSGLDITYSTSSDKVSIEGNLVTLSEPGRITITAKQDGNDDYNAASSVDASFCINPAKPTITASPIGATITLTSSSDVGNQWYLNEDPIPSANGKTYVVSSDGEYSVIAKVDDCSSLTSTSYTAVVAGDIKELTNITLYPNPADTHLYYKTTAPNEEALIYSVDGRKIDLVPAKQGDMLVFYIKELGAGAYVLKVNNNGKRLALPWMKM